MRTKLYRLTMVILCVAGIFFTGQQANAQGMTVVIPAEASVSGQYFTLGDVAVIYSDDAERTDNLRRIRLGHTPAPGHSYVINKELILARLHAANVFAATDITWNIPAQLTVTASSQAVSGKQLLEQAEQYLKATVTGDATITALGEPQDALVPPGIVTYKIMLPYGIRYNTPTNISVGIQVDGQVITQAIVRFEIKKYLQVAVAAKSLSAGEVITADNTTFERRDIGRLMPGYFTELAKIQGLSVKRPMAPGVVLTESMLKKAVIITRGKPVNIIAQIGNIQVMVAGTALQNGSEGQFIQVKNTSSRKVIIGRVIDDTTVRINM
jgi:flagella basal body P-ring formation protein FlgA